MTQMSPISLVLLTTKYRLAYDRKVGHVHVLPVFQHCPARHKKTEQLLYGLLCPDVLPVTHASKCRSVIIFTIIHDTDMRRN